MLKLQGNFTLSRNVERLNMWNYILQTYIVTLKWIDYFLNIYLFFLHNKMIGLLVSDERCGVGMSVAPTIITGEVLGKLQIIFP